MIILKFLNLEGKAEYVRADHIFNVTETEATNTAGVTRPATLIQLNKKHCGSSYFTTYLSARSVAALWAWAATTDYSGAIYESDGEVGHSRVF
jgi:hypothetical protein